MLLAQATLFSVVAVSSSYSIAGARLESRMMLEHYQSVRDS
jgi:hypothetical protein